MDYTNLQKLIKRYKTVSELSRQLDINENELLGILFRMKEQGHNINVQGDNITIPKAPIIEDREYFIPNNLTTLKMLLISDTHLVSKYDRLDILRYVYKKAEERGITTVLHAGDFTDGKSNRAEHIYELRHHSLEDQVDYCVDNYPKLNNGGKTYTIAGNHDLWWYKSTGSDIVKMIANRREDIVYLGPDSATMNIGKVKIRLFHGNGGPAYAKSYKLQKYLDRIPYSEMPDILCTGHIHEAFYYVKDKTHCFQIGTLEELTPFGRSLGFGNSLSCWWVTVELDQKGNIVSVIPELETFTEEKVKVKRK